MKKRNVILLVALGVLWAWSRSNKAPAATLPAVNAANLNPAASGNQQLSAPTDQQLYYVDADSNGVRG